MEYVRVADLSTSIANYFSYSYATPLPDASCINTINYPMKGRVGVATQWACKVSCQKPNAAARRSGERLGSSSMFHGRIQRMVGVRFTTDGTTADILEARMYKYLADATVPSVIPNARINRIFDSSRRQTLGGGFFRAHDGFTVLFRAVNNGKKVGRRLLKPTSCKMSYTVLSARRAIDNEPEIPVLCEAEQYPSGKWGYQAAPGRGAHVVAEFPGHIAAPSGFLQPIILITKELSVLVMLLERGESLAAFNFGVLRADKGDERWVWSSAGILGRKTRLTASSGTIPTCENPAAAPPGIEPGSHGWEASSLTTTTPRIRSCLARHGHANRTIVETRLGNMAAIPSSQCPHIGASVSPGMDLTTHDDWLVPSAVWVSRDWWLLGTRPFLRQYWDTAESELTLTQSVLGQAAEGSSLAVSRFGTASCRWRESGCEGCRGPVRLALTEETSQHLLAFIWRRLGSGLHRKLSLVTDVSKMDWCGQLIEILCALDEITSPLERSTKHSPRQAPMSIIGASMEWRRNEGAGKMGDRRENQPTSGIKQHDSHMQKCGSVPAEIAPWFALIPPARPWLRPRVSEDLGMDFVSDRLLRAVKDSLLAVLLPGRCQPNVFENKGKFRLCIVQVFCVLVHTETVRRRWYILPFSPPPRAAWFSRFHSSRHRNRLRVAGRKGGGTCWAGGLLSGLVPRTIPRFDARLQPCETRQSLELRAGIASQLAPTATTHRITYEWIHRRYRLFT
ncbi:hypothetical protein PR048_014783, partial [Dryococelus australis]